MIKFDYYVQQYFFCDDRTMNNYSNYEPCSGGNCGSGGKGGRGK